MMPICRQKKNTSRRTRKQEKHSKQKKNTAQQRGRPLYRKKKQGPIGTPLALQPLDLWSIGAPLTLQPWDLWSHRGPSGDHKAQEPLGPWP
jgi:hypothetical protein